MTKVGSLYLLGYFSEILQYISVTATLYFGFHGHFLYFVLDCISHLKSFVILKVFMVLYLKRMTRFKHMMSQPNHKRYFQYSIKQSNIYYLLTSDYQVVIILFGF